MCTSRKPGAVRANSSASVSLTKNELVEHGVEVREGALALDGRDRVLLFVGHLGVTFRCRRGDVDHQHARSSGAVTAAPPAAARSAAKIGRGRYQALARNPAKIRVAPRRDPDTQQLGAARVEHASEIRDLVALAVAVRLADFAPVGQSAFCQGWQLCVTNAVSVGWIITT